MAERFEDLPASARAQLNKWRKEDHSLPPHKLLEKLFEEEEQQKKPGRALTTKSRRDLFTRFQHGPFYDLVYREIYDYFETSHDFQQDPEELFRAMALEMIGKEYVRGLFSGSSRCLMSPISNFRLFWRYFPDSKVYMSGNNRFTLHDVSVADATVQDREKLVVCEITAGPSRSKVGWKASSLKKVQNAERSQVRGKRSRPVFEGSRLMVVGFEKNTGIEEARKKGYKTVTIPSDFNSFREFTDNLYRNESPREEVPTLHEALQQLKQTVTK